MSRPPILSATEARERVIQFLVAHMKTHACATMDAVTVVAVIDALPSSTLRTLRAYAPASAALSAKQLGNLIQESTRRIANAAQHRLHEELREELRGLLSRFSPLLHAADMPTLERNRDALQRCLDQLQAEGVLAPAPLDTDAG